MDDGFFQAFNADLSNESLWHKFNTSFKHGKSKLKDAAIKNSSMLGDHVSLKAEAADSKPTDEDRGAKSDVGTFKKALPRTKGRGKLKDAAMKNPSLLGDPVSLKAPSADSEPTDQDRGAQSSSQTGHDPQRTTRSPVDPEAPAPTMTSLSSSKQGPGKQGAGGVNVPALPKIDGKALFWSMSVTS